MRILQLGKFFPIKGGVEKVEYDLMTGLSKHGINCDMLCAMTNGKGECMNINEYANLICCKSWKQIAGTTIAPSIITKLRKICNNYDIIHVHHPDPMACFALFLSGFKGKVILHWHSDIIKQKKLLKAYLPLQKWLIKRADLILGTTPVYVKESPHLRSHQNKCAWLPIGIDQIQIDNEGAEKVRNMYPGKKIIFSVGRLVPYKGFNHLIEAAALLPDDYIVLIGGQGPLKEFLHKRIESKGINDKVKLLGFLTDEELYNHYGACSAFCLPSVMKTEAFGIVQIEAMSCGKPVIATNIPQSGVSWVNAHGVSGVNVTPGEATELADAIMHLLGEERTYTKYAQGALERFQQMFTFERMIDKCIKYYETLMETEKTTG